MEPLLTVYLFFSYVDYNLAKQRRNYGEKKTSLCAERGVSPVAPDLEMSKIKKYGSHHVILCEHH